MVRDCRKSYGARRPGRRDLPIASARRSSTRQPRACSKPHRLGPTGHAGRTVRNGARRGPAGVQFDSSACTSSTGLRWINACGSRSARSSVGRIADGLHARVRVRGPVASSVTQQQRRPISVAVPSTAASRARAGPEWLRHAASAAGSSLLDSTLTRPRSTGGRRQLETARRNSATAAAEEGAADRHTFGVQPGRAPATSGRIVRNREQFHRGDRASRTSESSRNQGRPPATRDPQALALTGVCRSARVDAAQPVGVGGAPGSAAERQRPARRQPRRFHRCWGEQSSAEKCVRVKKIAIWSTNDSSSGAATSGIGEIFTRTVQHSSLPSPAGRGASLRPSSPGRRGLVTRTVPRKPGRGTARSRALIFRSPPSRVRSAGGGCAIRRVSPAVRDR